MKPTMPEATAIKNLSSDKTDTQQIRQRLEQAQASRDPMALLPRRRQGVMKRT